ncbi:hypothetical protein [Micromonospora sp. NPDC023633]|uniref:hypothetical protein n=1 Tax=Micromonospora sp. NPDC023633 TaxID=3154320 RepID=UPI003408D4F1
MPDFMEGALGRWLDDYLYEHLEEELGLHLRTSADLRSVSGEDLLDVIDAMLYWHPDRSTPEDGEEPSRDDKQWAEIVRQLAFVLHNGGSAWRVNEQLDGLERRIGQTVTAAMKEAKSSAREDARDHLETAWRAAYGREPDPDKAYSEAVKAVEAVACPMVCPNNPRRSLGTVIRDLRSQSAQWELAIGDGTGDASEIGRLVEMLALLWQGQSRHAGSPNSRRHTQIEGESTVHLAVTIVQWLNSGVLRRKADGVAP